MKILTTKESNRARIFIKLISKFLIFNIKIIVKINLNNKLKMFFKKLTKDMKVWNKKTKYLLIKIFNV
jgi:hypothetical protein